MQYLACHKSSNKLLDLNYFKKNFKTEFCIYSLEGSFRQQDAGWIRLQERHTEISQEATTVIQDRGYEDISDEVREEGIK